MSGSAEVPQIDADQHRRRDRGDRADRCRGHAVAGPKGSPIGRNFTDQALAGSTVALKIRHSLSSPLPLQLTGWEPLKALWREGMQRFPSA